MIPFPAPRSTPTKPVLWFLGSVWALLSLNLLFCVARFQVNVLAWDQWDFYATLFNGSHSAWDLFHYQHGPHRQGLGWVLTSWLLDATNWDTRWDSLWIAGLIAASGLLALRLKWKLTGRLEFRDAWIPILGLTLGQFETILIVPNASHSAAPIALLLLLANFWLSPRVFLRYLAAGVGAVCLTFTGFGLFAGAVALVLLLVATVRHALAREWPATLAAGLGTALALAGWLVFRSDYVFTPAVAGFRFPWDPVSDYFRFIALMLLQPTGVANVPSLPHYLFGSFLAIVVLTTAVYLVWQWVRARRASPALDVMVLLIGAGGLFVCNTAVGRISLGIPAGMSSRYITLMFPLWLALSFAAATAGRKSLGSAAALLLWLIALWPYGDLLHRPLAQWPGTVGATDSQYQYFEFHTTTKAAWIDTYLKTGDIAAAQRIGTVVYPAPEATHLDDKLRYLRERRLSFFAAPAPARAFLPWLLRGRAIWDDGFPTANSPRLLGPETKLNFVSSRDGLLEIPLHPVAAEDSAGFELILKTATIAQTERGAGDAVLTVPIKAGFNSLALSRLSGPPLRAGPVHFIDPPATGPAAIGITLRPPAVHDASVNPSAFLLLASWLLVASVVAGPALATYCWLQSRQVTDERLLVIVPLVAVGLLGYLGFFAFYANATLGKFLAIAIAAAGWASATRHLRRSPRPSWNQAATVPLLLALGLSLFYLALLYLPALGQPFARQSAFRFMHELPPDAILPQIVGDRLYAGEALRPFVLDWLCSDRPPLQSGLYVLILPWLKLFNLPAGLGYQVIGTFAQLVWVPAAWLLARALGQDRTRSALTVLVVSIVGFFILNSVFVWPKLLAGGFVVFAGTLLLDRSRPLEFRVVLLAAACASLGWLAHGGAAFSLLALVPFVLLVHRPSWKQLGGAAALFGLIVLPWVVYQKFCDPPGDRLLKYHLAAVTAVDPRGTLQTLRDAYSALSWDAWVFNRRSNFVLLFQGSFRDVFDLFTTSARQRRVEEFFYVFRAVGVLNLAWLVWPIAWIFRRRAFKPPAFAWTLVGWTVLTLALWCVLMFAPTSTVNHQGSYAAVVVACVLGTGLLLDLPLWIGGLILGWHALYFAITWLPYYGTAPLNRSMALVFLLALAPLAAALALARRESPPTKPAV